MEQNLPAVGAPFDAPVMPRAWAWRDEPSGIEVYSGWDEPRPTNGSEPLYDQAALDAAVAAERERLRVMLTAHLDQTEVSHHVTLAECHAARNALQLVLDQWA